MDAPRFDQWTRRRADSGPQTVLTLLRRAMPRPVAVRALAGLGLALVGAIPDREDATAKKKRKKKRTKKCKHDKKRCGGKCVNVKTNPAHCGGCTPCPVGQSCVGGDCGLGPGTCETGDDVCQPGGVNNCNALPGCDCLTRFVTNDLVCGNIAGCTVCDEDADCANFGAGAFCARKTGTLCCVNLAMGQGFCGEPCGT